MTTITLTAVQRAVLREVNTAPHPITATAVATTLSADVREVATALERLGNDRLTTRVNGRQATGRTVLRWAATPCGAAIADAPPAPVTTTPADRQQEDAVAKVADLLCTIAYGVPTAHAPADLAAAYTATARTAVAAAETASARR